MSKICISNSAKDARFPVWATYKWPESEAEFVKSAAARGGGARPRSALTESISCRQKYLRSYKFSRKESVLERTLKCFGKERSRVVEIPRRRRRRRCVLARRVKELSRAIFRRLLFCASTVDVA